MESTFKVMPHSGRDVETIEVRLGGSLKAVIYPIENGVRVISSHISEVKRPDLMGPQVYDFKFNGEIQ